VGGKRPRLNAHPALLAAVVLLCSLAQSSAADNEPVDTDGNGDPDFVRVTDWNGNGVLEMSDVQAAVDALTDSGWKEVVVGPGEYAGPGPRPGHVLELPSRFVLRGDAGGGTLLRGFGPDDLTSTGAVVSNRNHSGGNSDITIRDIEIDGGWATEDATGFGHSRMGVYFSSCTRCRVASSTVRDTLHACLYSKNGEDVDFVDNTLLRCGNYRGSGSRFPCVYLYANSGRTQRDVHVTGNSCAGSGATGLTTRREDSTGVLAGIHFIGNSVSDSRVDPVPAPCLGFGGVDGGIVADNTCVDTGSVAYFSDSYYSEGRDPNASRDIRIDGLSIVPVAGEHGLEIHGYLEDSSIRNVDVSNVSSNRHGLVFETPLTNVVFEGIRLTDCGGVALSDADGYVADSSPQESLVFRDVVIEYSNAGSGDFPAIRFRSPIRNLLIDGLDVNGASGDGIRFLNDVNGAVIRNARIRNVSGHGISAVPGAVLRDFVVRDSTVEESGGSGLSLVLDAATTSSAVELAGNSLYRGCKSGGEGCSVIHISGSADGVWIGDNFIEDEGEAAFGVYHDVSPFEDPTYLCTNHFAGALDPANYFLVTDADAIYRDDADGDQAVDGCDCAPLDGTTYPGAAESNDGIDNNCPGDTDHGVADETSGAEFSTASGRHLYSWDAQHGATSYEVARSSSPEFASCRSAIVSDNRLVDVSTPPSGAAYYFLNRPVKPIAGSWGQDSKHNERVGNCSRPETDRRMRRLPPRRGRSR